MALSNSQPIQLPPCFKCLPLPYPVQGTVWLRYLTASLEVRIPLLNSMALSQIISNIDGYRVRFLEADSEIEFEIK